MFSKPSYGHNRSHSSYLEPLLLDWFGLFVPQLRCWPVPAIINSWADQINISFCHGLVVLKERSSSYYNFLLLYLRHHHLFKCSPVYQNSNLQTTSWSDGFKPYSIHWTKLSKLKWKAETPAVLGGAHGPPTGRGSGKGGVLHRKQSLY